MLSKSYWILDTLRYKKSTLDRLYKRKLKFKYDYLKEQNDYSKNNVFKSKIVDKYFELRGDICEFKFTLFQLVLFSIHIGHIRNSTKTLSSWFIYGFRNFISLINLIKTINILRQVVAIIKWLSQRRGQLLFINHKTSLSTFITKTALNSNQSYIVGTWLGGLLTNFKILFLTFLNSYKNIVKYNLFGILRLNRLPNIIFISSLVESRIVFYEATLLYIPLISIVDTNANSKNINYPIFGNDDSFSSIYFYHIFMIKLIKKYRIYIIYNFISILYLNKLNFKTQDIFKKFIYILNIKCKNLNEFIFNERKPYKKKFMLILFIYFQNYFNQFVDMFISVFRFDYVYTKIFQNNYKNSNILEKSDLIYLK